MRRKIEGLVLLGSALLALKWITDPSGPYEPILAFIGASWASLDFFFGKREGAPSNTPSRSEDAPTRSTSTPLPKKPDTPALPYFKWNSTSDFFADRFANAFPGLRSSTWFNGQEAADRLALLLQPPLTFKNEDYGETSPIWWFGRGNLQVDKFKRIDARTVLINFDEYNISRLAAIYSSSYRRIWVYVETEPMAPTGLYPRTAQNLEAAKAQSETYAEEYAIVDGQHKVTRAEYDDGHANIGGKITPIAGNSELRVRQLRPYNFVLCSHDSPINNINFDSELEAFLDEMLLDPSVFDKYSNLISRLPITRNP
ncbi:hypothetical protein [Aquabacterium sp.]|uniref:hypothetical protein n=1 Tax=Aquabacterium sp. TaxID=1872578 RepID=UPI0024887BA4|nr:hypothetical protein [Aquabacterium sp.]MDI1350695.1 hypothetical protein [Aquabacterium sp.]